ncbi:hypothetical protein GQ607_004071 [Colletotrichum asianum]|uniref:Uncharacterized protein n=1 Tax=Colletotrichum asianum TaxID=702518 RepID=A0A8H3ZQG4_9PEZI|nr:hypothetical protein GQ607_004071 [Colletotrichum asianum]
MYPDAAPALCSRCETHCYLPEVRTSRWLDDEDAPRVLSAMTVDGNARRERALAEIDGIFAGLTYLEKLGDTQVLQDSQTSRNLCDFGEILDGIRPDSFGILEEGMIPNEITLPNFEELGLPCVSEEEIPTDEIKQAWSGLRGLRKGLEHQHQRLKSIASEASSKNIQKLEQAFTSPRRMGEMGILAYRDVLDFVVPHTLAEIVAFTSVSYVISNLLLQRGRIAETDIFSGSSRWGDCITDVEDRKAFASFASKMWPLEHFRTADDSGKRSGQDEDKDLHHFRTKRPRFEDNSSLRSFSPQSSPNPVGQGSSSKEIRDAALFTSHGLGMLSETMPPLTYDQQHFSEIENLVGDVMDITDQTSEEYDFSQFLSLFGDPCRAVGGPGQHNDHFSFCPGVDPKSREYYWSGLALDEIPSQTFSPMSDPHILPQSPLPAKECPLIGTDDHAVKRSTINFECFNRDGDTAIFKLRDTPMFLAVLAFSQDTGEVFYRLSGCGKTVQATRSSSAYTHERSKAEKRLRKGLFDPMKKSGSGNVVFLALLSVAKNFVILGSLGTFEQVQDYLVAISREVIEPGREHEMFIRWVYSCSSSHPSGTDAYVASDKKTAQGHCSSATETL